MFKKRDQQLLAEAYADVINENRVYRQDGAYTADELRDNKAERNYRSGHSRVHTHYGSDLDTRLDDEDGPFFSKQKYQTKIAMSTDSNIKKLCGYMGYKDESKQISFKNPENIVYIGIKNINYEYSTDWYDAQALNRKKAFGVLRPGNKPDKEKGAQLLQISRVGDDRYNVTVNLLPYIPYKWSASSDLPKKEILNEVVNFVDLESVLTQLNEEIESGKYNDVIVSIRGSHEYPINKGKRFHSGWPLKRIDDV